MHLHCQHERPTHITHPQTFWSTIRNAYNFASQRISRTSWGPQRASCWTTYKPPMTTTSWRSAAEWPPSCCLLMSPRLFPKSYYSSVRHTTRATSVPGFTAGQRRAARLRSPTELLQRRHCRGLTGGHLSHHRALPQVVFSGRA